ncbi:MAG: phage holin family protein, partial [Anaerolineae bacterium]
VPGITVEQNALWLYAIMAVILGLVNALVRPLLKLLTCPLILLTLGLFVLIVNALTLWLASSIAVNWFNVGFYVDGFWPALLGSLVVSIVTVVLSALVKEE